MKLDIGGSRNREPWEGSCKLHNGKQTGVFRKPGLTQKTQIKLKSGPIAKLRLTGHRVTLEVMDDSHVLANQQFGLA